MKKIPQIVFGIAIAWVGMYIMVPMSGCTTVGTVAGTGTAGCTDGVGASAEFNNPSGLVSDPWENVYVADASCHKIRQLVHGAGNVTSYAGTGAAGCTDGPVLTTAQFRDPVDVTRDSSGNYFVADRGNHIIRKIAPDGNVSTVAGLCNQALAAPTQCQKGIEPCKVKTKVPDKVSINDALFNRPSGVAVDSSGNIFVADYATCSVRKIDTAGNVTTLGKKDGKKVAAYATCCGQCTGAFRYPTGIDLDAAGNIYVAEYWGHQISRIDAVTEDITPIAGTVWGFKDGPGNEASFMHPYHLVVDKVSGDIYVADLGNNRIRKVANDGFYTVSTLAGEGVLGMNDCMELGTKASCAQFNHPRGVEFVRKLMLYIGDTGNHRIRSIKY